MAKIDYSKAENLLNDALLKMSIKNLLLLADNPHSFEKPLSKENLPSLQARTILMTLLEHDITLLSSVKEIDQDKLGISKKQVQLIIENISEVTLDDWKKLKKIRERVLSFKQEMREKLPLITDQEVIDRARKTHIHKRMNVRDGWLPLQ